MITEQLLSALKDNVAITVAFIAATVSKINLIWSTRLNEGRERRKVLWERELNRFSELEDTAGRLVEDMLSYNIRSEQERAASWDKLQNLRAATGRFLRYPEIASALREVTHSAGWYISQDMKHETKTDFEEARNDVTASFDKLVAAINITLNDAPKRL